MPGIVLAGDGEMMPMQLPWLGACKRKVGRCGFIGNAPMHGHSSAGQGLGTMPHA